MFSTRTMSYPQTYTGPFLVSLPGEALGVETGACPRAYRASTLPPLLASASTGALLPSRHGAQRFRDGSSSAVGPAHAGDWEAWGNHTMRRTDQGLSEGTRKNWEVREGKCLW